MIGSNQVDSHFIQESIQAEQPETQDENLDDDELYRVFPEMVFTALVRNIAADNIADKPGEENDGEEQGHAGQSTKLLA